MGSILAGAISARTGAIMSGCAVRAPSWRLRPGWMGATTTSCRRASCRSRADLPFGPDGRLFLASGMGLDGIGDNSIVAFAPDRQRLASFVYGMRTSARSTWLLRRTGNVLVGSEHPFGMADAVTTLQYTMPPMGVWCACFARTGWRNSASRAACGSDRTATSTASRRTRWSPSTSPPVDALERRCGSLAYVRAGPGVLPLTSTVAAHSIREFRPVRTLNVPTAPLNE